MPGGWARGDAASVLGGQCGPCRGGPFIALLSAFLMRLSCPSVCLRPLCSGAALPAPGGSVGSVNGYHTCKGELAVTAVPARACRGCLAISLSVFCLCVSIRENINHNVTPSASHRKWNEPADRLANSRLCCAVAGAVGQAGGDGGCRSG